jgi:hypothetical protein
MSETGVYEYTGFLLKFPKTESNCRELLGKKMGRQDLVDKFPKIV